MEEGIIIPVLGILCAIALPLILVILSVYWTVTSKHKEKMAMIERGIAPDENASDRQPNRYGSLRNGLLMIGLAIGTIAGIFLARTMKEEYEMFLIIVAMIVVCGGIAFTSYFFISKKLMEQEEKNSIDRF
jgi:drug/metabolite transporter (DMT)-like permease